MSKLKITHLIDDTTAGGVMRAVTYLASHAALTESAEHKIVQTRKSALKLGSYDADIIVSHATLNWRGLPGLISLRAMNPGARLIHVEHSYTRCFTALNVSHRKRFFAMLRLSYALFDHVVAVSDDQGKWLSDRGLVNPDCLVIIPPRIDVAPFEEIAAVDAPAKSIGAIGRLDRQKGFDILIKGFRDWNDPDARLLIFGDGRERAELERLAECDHRIEFRGHVEDPAAAMASVSVVAMPSRWEAYGLVCLEALAAGRTIIASGVDGLNDANRGRIKTVQRNAPEVWSSVLSALPCSRQRERPSPATRQEAGWLKSWQQLFQPQ